MDLDSEIDQISAFTTVVLYKWTLDNFSTHQESVYEAFTIKSPIFTGPPEHPFQYGTKWQMEVSKIENEEKISFGLSSLNDFEISVDWQFTIAFTIMKNKSPKIISVFEGRSCYYTNVSINCATLANNIAEANNQLEIDCTISFIKKGEKRFFQNNLINSISRLIETQEHSDVILIASDGREHKAHKAILSCRSEVFSAMFKHNMSKKQTNLVKIEDMDSETLKEMLQFIYTGVIEDFQCDKIKKLLIAANKYILYDLEEICVDYLCENINNDNNLDMIKFAYTYNISELEQKSTDYFLKNCGKIMLAKGFQCIEELSQDLTQSLFYSLALNQVSNMVSNSEFGQVIIETVRDETTYRWTLKNFSTHQKSLQEALTIKSPIFTIQRELYLEKVTKWQMEVSKIENEENISFGLSSLNDFEISVDWQFTIMKNKSPKIISVFEGRSYYCANVCINCEDLANKIAKTNDQLEIDCTISFIKKEEQRFLQNNLVYSISELIETQEHSNVILIASDGTEHKAHKAILSCRSRVFSAMFEHNMTEKQTNVVKIEDMDSETLKKMLQFIYTGAIEEFQCDKIQKLLIAADKYDLNDLKEMCDHFLCKNININNNLDLIELASVYNISDLKRKSTEFFLENCKRVILTKGLNCIKELEQCTRDTLLYAFMSNHLKNSILRTKGEKTQKGGQQYPLVVRHVGKKLLSPPLGKKN